MINLKRIFLILIISVSLGGCSTSDTDIIHKDTNNSSLIEFELDNNSSFIHKTYELKINKTQSNLELVDVDEKNGKLYTSFTSSEKTIYKVNNLYNNNHEILLYESENVFATALSGIYKDTLYVVETLSEGDKFTTEIVLIDSKKNVNKYKVSTMDKIPYVQQIDDILIINYEIVNKNIVESYLVCFDMDTKKLNIIAKNNYLINSSGNVTGDYILFAGGLGDIIYYQIVKYRNEDLEKEGTAYVYRVNKKDMRNSKKAINLNEKLIFISGNDNIIITSDYIYEAPFYDSGKLYVRKNDNWLYHVIPGITAGNDIIGVHEINKNTLLIFTSEDYYLYDYKEKKYMKNSYIKESGMYSSIKSYKSKFFYLEKINDRYFLHLYDYNDKR